MDPELQASPVICRQSPNHMPRFQQGNSAEMETGNASNRVIADVQECKDILRYAVTCVLIVRHCCLCLDHCSDSCAAWVSSVTV